MRTFDLWRRGRRAAGVVLATGASALIAAVIVGAPSGGPLGSAAASAQTSSPTCQDTTPIGVSGTWKCTFDDEFNGTSLDTSLWVPQLTATSGFTAGPDCYVNNPNVLSVSGGYLHLSVRKVAPFTCAGNYTSSYQAGMVTTSGLFDQTYGAFEVNAKLPPATVSGLQETLWLYPQNLTYGPWPSSGEIDFAEFYSEYAGYDVPFIHYAYSSYDPNVTAYNCTFDQNAFNTYGVDWTPTSITILYNGKTCLVDHPLTGGVPFNQPFMIALTQALGLGTNAFNASSTPLPATTTVDWVRAWSQTS